MASSKGKKKADTPEPTYGMRPGGPNNIARGYTPGANAGGLAPGAESANLSAASDGGDIDRPDITGRGSLDDIVQHGDVGQGTMNNAATGPDQHIHDRTAEEQRHGRDA